MNDRKDLHDALSGGDPFAGYRSPGGAMGEEMRRRLQQQDKETNDRIRAMPRGPSARELKRQRKAAEAAKTARKKAERQAARNQTAARRQEKAERREARRTQRSHHAGARNAAAQTLRNPARPRPSGGGGFDELLDPDFWKSLPIIVGVLLILSLPFAVHKNISLMMLHLLPLNAGRLASGTIVACAISAIYAVVAARRRSLAPLAFRLYPGDGAWRRVGVGASWALLALMLAAWALAIASFFLDPIRP